MTFVSPGAEPELFLRARADASLCKVVSGGHEVIIEVRCCTSEQQGWQRARFVTELCPGSLNDKLKLSLLTAGLD